MTGLLTILEGAGKGTSKPLSSALVIVGRSKNADFQIDDPLASRLHLEIRTETDGVFVENKSTQGSVSERQTPGRHRVVERRRHH